MSEVIFGFKSTNNSAFAENYKKRYVFHKRHLAQKLFSKIPLLIVFSI